MQRSDRTQCLYCSKAYKSSWANFLHEMYCPSNPGKLTREFKCIHCNEIFPKIELRRIHTTICEQNPNKLLKKELAVEEIDKILNKLYQDIDESTKVVISKTVKLYNAKQEFSKNPNKANSIKLRREAVKVLNFSRELASRSMLDVKFRSKKLKLTRKEYEFKHSKNKRSL